MHIHQLPPPIDQVQHPPPPKRAETARPPGAFEQLTPLAVKQRSPNERKQQRGERPQPPNARGNPTAAPPAQAATARHGTIDIIV